MLKILQRDAKLAFRRAVYATACPTVCPSIRPSVTLR